MQCLLSTQMFQERQLCIITVTGNVSRSEPSLSKPSGHALTTKTQFADKVRDDIYSLTQPATTVIGSLTEHKIRANYNRFRLRQRHFLPVLTKRQASQLFRTSTSSGQNNHVKCFSAFSAEN
jgi:hypothetical protein